VLAATAGVTAMIDVSDGLVRSLYLLARESEVGCSIEAARLPVLEDLSGLMKQAEALDAILFGGEDYELLFTVPERAIGGIDPTVEWTAIGRVTAAGVLLDGRELPDRGYEH
jgi:thiamine-monophosphate kinase